MQIDKIITDYVLSKETDYAIMIDGEWGAGKSWYWDNVLTEQIKEIPTRDNTEEKPSMYNVAKISLFGISSVDDLRIKIFEETSTFFANKYVKTGAKFTVFDMDGNKISAEQSRAEIVEHHIAVLFLQTHIQVVVVEAHKVVEDV